MKKTTPMGSIRDNNQTIGSIVFGPDSFPRSHDGFKFPPIDVAVGGSLTQEFKIPPLGLRPRSIASSQRMQEILDAMYRYVGDGKKIPNEWLEELYDINEDFK